MRVMSTSNMQCTCALVRRDSIIRCAMMRRMLVRGTRSPGIAVVAGRGAGGAGAGADVIVEGWASPPGKDGCWTGETPVTPEFESMKANMSCFVMRPPRPVPSTCERLTLCSRAILRTRGDERACSSSSCLGAAGVVGGAAEVVPSACGAAADGASALGGAGAAAAFFSGAFGAAAPSPSAEIVPTTVFT